MTEIKIRLQIPGLVQKCYIQVRWGQKIWCMVICSKVICSNPVSADPLNFGHLQENPLQQSFAATKIGHLQQK